MKNRRQKRTLQKMVKRAIRNSEKLPPIEFRTAVSDAVHAAVSQHFNGAAFDKCAIYATVGGLVCSVLLNTPYTAHMGGFQIMVSDDLGFEIDPRAAREEGRPEGLEFHAVILAPRGDKIEVIDLAARHYKTMVTRLGFPWERESPPDFIWDWSENILPRYGVWFGVDEISTQLCRPAVIENWGDMVRDMGRDALKRLGYRRS